MGVEIDVGYIGALKSKAVHGPSGSVIVTSAPKDNMGDGMSFSPTDLAATALATCVLTTMAIAARRLDLELAGATAHVEKVMSADPPRRIARLPMSVTMPPGIPAEHREALERAGRTCPVASSLSPGIDVAMTFTWG